MSSAHIDIDADRGVHPPYTFEYATGTDRTNGSPAKGPKDPQTGQFRPLSVFPPGILAFTQDSSAIHKLTNPATGTWTEVAGGGGGGPPDTHQATHLAGGTDVIDADRLEISYSPTNYVRDNTPAPVTSVVELTSHLAGIDNKLGNIPFAPTFLQYGLTANSPNVTSNAWVVLNFDDQVLNESDFAYAGGVCTVQSAGLYSVKTDLTLGATSTNSRSTGQSRVQVNVGGSGFAQLSNTLRSYYHRQVSQGKTSGTVSGRLIALSAGDTIRVQIRRESGGAPIAALANSCLFTVERVR